LAYQPDHPCLGCGKTLPATSGQGRRRLYCSNTCRPAGHPRNRGNAARASIAADPARQAPATADAAVRRTPRTGVCDECGVSFLAAGSSGNVSSKCPDHRVRVGNYIACRGCGKPCSNTARGKMCRECQKRPCLICGKIGVGYRYCSARCRNRATERCQCLECGREFIGGRGRRTCSRACMTARQKAAPRSSRPCAGCGAEIIAPRRLCKPCRAGRIRVGWHVKSVKRRGIASASRIEIRGLGERDGWRCHLCKRKVNPTVEWPHPRSPSFDHLIPISAGRPDDPTNLALAHLGCNMRRGTRGTAQLLLFG
jgi:hypothetical protein